MKRYKYEFLHFDFRDKMVHVMNEKSQEGWEPVGGPFVYANQVCWAIRKEISEVDWTIKKEISKGKYE